MAIKATLPDEAVDVTVSELHEAAVSRLVDALRVIFAGKALVLSEIFLRVGSDDAATGEQVSADLMIISGAQRGTRNVYRVPDEPVPAVTVEILSSANYEEEGRALLEKKRDLLGRIGVPTHIEIDPERGFVTVWENHETALTVTGPPDDHYDSPALCGLRLGLQPAEMRLWMPDGREYLDAAAETARADAANARAERYREILRSQGVDPDA
jgi:Uma2 family endonuclease